MTIILWLALGLLFLWIVVKFVFKVVGCAVHLLLIAALLAVAFWFLRKGV